MLLAVTLLAWRGGGCCLFT